MNTPPRIRPIAIAVCLSPLVVIGFVLYFLIPGLLPAGHAQPQTAGNSVYLPIVATGWSGQWRCWDMIRGFWGIPCQGPDSITSFDMLSNTDGWLVGQYGLIAHWDGNAWYAASSPTANSLNSVSMLSTDDGWIVGEGGVTLHWDGQIWSSVSSPVTRTLQSVSFSSPTDGWAVGDGGSILHWTGNEWLQVPCPATVWPPDVYLQSVSAVTPTDAWAVGMMNVFPSGDTDALILRWDGNSWATALSASRSASLTPPPMSEISQWPPSSTDSTLNAPPSPPEGIGLTSISMNSAIDGWATGYYYYAYGWSHGTLYHWDGAAWTSSTIPKVLDTIDMYSPITGWGVGNDLVMRWDGTSWITETIPGFPDTNWKAVSVISESSVWVMGESFLVHWDGSQWNQVLVYSSDNTFPPLRYPNPMKISMSSSSDGWMIDSDGGYLHWNGLTWEPNPGAGLWPLDVAASSPTDTWAVGTYGEYASASHWDGSTWALITSTTRAFPYAVAVVAPMDIWLVGKMETEIPAMMHYQNEQFVTMTLPITGSALLAASAVSPEDIWAVGTNSLIAHWDGSTWITATSPISDANLNAIEMVSATDGWIVGYKEIFSGFFFVYEPTMLHWDGFTWQTISLPVTSDVRLYDISMLSSNEGWAVGTLQPAQSAAAPLVLYWNGSDWQVINVPETHHTDIYTSNAGTLYTIDMVSRSQGWAGGTYTLMQYKNWK